MVDVVDGPLKGKSGTVRHVMRGILFVQSREVHENGGFICVRATHCKVRVGLGSGGSRGRVAVWACGLAAVTQLRAGGCNCLPWMLP